MLRANKSIRSVVLAAAVLLAGCKDATDPDADPGLVNSTFTADGEGWTLFGDFENPNGEPYWFGGGGNPGGFITAQDAVRSDSWYFVAPAKHLGDLSEAYDKDLRFDLAQNSTLDQDLESPMVVLTGGGVTLNYYPATTPGMEWTRFRVRLHPSAGWRNAATGAAATEQELRNVLSDLTDFLIRGEYVRGADSGSLDNVYFGVAR